jgi:diketogulonate reductase-like aldo/keto reductase
MSTTPRPDDRAIPPILYGTAWKKERTAELVERALGLGFRGVDTACQPKHYDEAGVGAGVTAALANGVTRAELFLQTKFTPIGGQDPKRVPYDPKASIEQQVQESHAVSLVNLRTTYIDCLVLHSPLATFERTLEVWRAFEQLVDAGSVRALGISNCYELPVLERLWQEARVKPRVVQNRFYQDTGFDRGIRAFCRERSLYYQSFWTLSANPHILAHEHVQRAASGHDVTPAQVLFRALTQLGVVPLTGTKSEVHMREDLAIFEFTMTPQELELVAGLFR